MVDNDHCLVVVACQLKEDNIGRHNCNGRDSGGEPDDMQNTHELDDVQDTQYLHCFRMAY